MTESGMSDARVTEIGDMRFGYGLSVEVITEAERQLLLHAVSWYDIQLELYIEVKRLREANAALENRVNRLRLCWESARVRQLNAVKAFHGLLHSYDTLTDDITTQDNFHQWMWDRLIARGKTVTALKTKLRASRRQVDAVRLVISSWQGGDWTHVSYRKAIECALGEPAAVTGNTDSYRRQNEDLLDDLRAHLDGLVTRGETPSAAELRMMLGDSVEVE